MSHNNEIAALLMEEEADEEYAMFLGMTVVEEERVVNERSASRCLGFVRGHVVIQRDRVQGHNRLYHDYFAEEPVYGPRLFRRRFRMHRPLFRRIASAVEDFDPYFVQKRNVVGNLGLSSLQKITATMQMLAYGVSTDFLDDYVRIGESTTIESVKRFVKVVAVIFADEYLRSPNNDDIRRLLEIGEQRGFPGMLGSIDCMHWRWKNCPAAWHGMYAGHVHELTIILEAVASYDLWIWHAFFGLLGSHNDVNVLERLNLFTELTKDRAPPVNYSINSHEYTMEYYLANGIYPQWSTFVKTISAPQGNKRKNFAQAQESARKDVERAFGVLQARFAIVRGPARFWDQEVLKDIMKACIIMHNMIIEDERDINQCDFNYDAFVESPTISLSRERTPQFLEFIQAHHHIRDRQTHSQLQADLIEHLWQRHGGD